MDKGIRAYIAPEFSSPLNEQLRIEEGNEINLHAQIEAYPTASVSWYRNGTRLRRSRRFSSTLDKNGCTKFVIANATKGDAGLYKCVTANAVGRAESNCRIIVDANETSTSTSNCEYAKAPLFVRQPRATETDKTIVIECEVIGDPKPNVISFNETSQVSYIDLNTENNKNRVDQNRFWHIKSYCENIS